MLSRPRTPPVCKRRGCDAPRERWQLVCPSCWTQIPSLGRMRYSRARRAGLTRIAAQIGRTLLRDLGRRPADPAAPVATADAYARHCALLGERAEIDGPE